MTNISDKNIMYFELAPTLNSDKDDLFDICTIIKLELSVYHDVSIT